jgi:hypothetical protein
MEPGRLILRSAPQERVSKDEASWFETRSLRSRSHHEEMRPSAKKIRPPRGSCGGRYTTG